MEATGDSPHKATIAQVLMNKRLARGVTLLVSVVMVVLLTQQFFGLGFTRKFEIKPERRIHQDGTAFRWRLSGDYQGDLMKHRGTVLENGRPLPNRATRSTDVRERGPGWYAFHAGTVWFAPADGTDPRTNGRHYEVVLPKQLEEPAWWPVLAVALMGCLIWIKGCATRIKAGAGVEGAQRRETAVLSTTLVFVSALLVSALRIVLMPGLTDGSLVIKGVPESDAGAWHEMAIGITEGLGLTTSFEAQRPLYAVMLSPAYLLFGGRILAAKGLNCIALSVAVAGIWVAGLVLRSRLACGMAAVALLFGVGHEALTHEIITENAGLCFGVASTLSIWLGIWHLSPRWCFVAGFLNAVGNLASGAALLTLPLHAAAVVVNPLIRRAPWRRTVVLAVAFTLGAALVLLPWMIRQKVAHGQFTLALNSMELLYGGAHPTERKLTRAIHAEAADAGFTIQDPSGRYQYFAAKFKAVVAENPVRWVSQVLGAAVSSFESVELSEPATRTAAVLAVLLAALIGSWKSGGITPMLMAAALIPAWVNLSTRMALPAVAALFFCCWRRAFRPEQRLLFSLLGLTILAVALLNGLSGNIAPRRFWLVGDWAILIVIMVGLTKLVHTGASVLNALLARTGRFRLLRADLQSVETRSSEGVVPAIIGLCTPLGAYAVGAMLVASALTALGSKPRWPAFDGLELSAVKESLVKRHPDKRLAGDPGRIRAVIASIEDLVLPMNAGEEFGHWLPQYQRRDYDHWIAALPTYTGDGRRAGYANAIIRGDIERVPRSKPLVWLGIDTQGVDRISQRPLPMFEVIAVCPIQMDGRGRWRIDVDQAIWFDPTPESLSTVSGLNGQP